MSTLQHGISKIVPDDWLLPLKDHTTPSTAALVNVIICFLTSTAYPAHSSFSRRSHSLRWSGFLWNDCQPVLCIVQGAHLLIPPDRSDYSNKRLININSLFCRRLDTLRIESFRQISTLWTTCQPTNLNENPKGVTMRLNLSFIFQITLIGNNDDGEIILILDLPPISFTHLMVGKAYSENLLVEC
jgi:hypothetical protein